MSKKLKIPTLNDIYPFDKKSLSVISCIDQITTITNGIFLDFNSPINSILLWKMIGIKETLVDSSSSLYETREIDINTWYSNWNNLNNVENFTTLTKDVVIISSDIRNCFKVVCYYILIKHFSNPLHTCDSDNSCITTTKTLENSSTLITPLITSRGMVNYTNMTDNLYYWAKNTLGIADEFLSFYYKYLNLSRTAIGKSKAYTKWFGCYSPDLVNNLQPKECDGLCQNDISIQLYDEVSKKNKECSNSSICIIDSSSINALNTSTNINFEQVCTGCSLNPSSPCICILDVSISTGLEKVSAKGGSLSNPVIFKQVCPNAKCLKKDLNTGEFIESVCGDNPSFANDISVNQGLTTKNYFVFIIIAAILLIVILASITGSNYNKASMTFILKN